MDEATVTQKIQSHLQSQGVETDQSSVIQETPQEEQPAIEAIHNNLPLDNMVLEQNIMDLLNIPNSQRMSTDTKDQINAITRWAAENASSKEMSDILETIHRQLRMMGAAFKEDRVQRLYRYTRLSSMRAGIEVQMRALHE